MAANFNIDDAQQLASNSRLIRIGINADPRQATRAILIRSGLFGLNGPQGADFPEQETEEITDLSGDAPDANRTSWLGTPVFADLRFPDDELILESVLVEVRQVKNIQRTPVQGRNGTVKEYIADGDYDISIRGVMTTPRINSYPLDEVRALVSILLRPEALEVVSDYLRIFNIYNMVVVDYRFAQQAGYQNMQMFEISAVSDEPEELIETETDA